MNLSLHLQTQLALQQMLSPHEVWLEKRFDSISRIADVVWPAKKLIFEVQVSPIAVEELRERNNDYAHLGYQVIWILHDHHFNRFHLTPAEIALRCAPHYYTSSDPSGKIYFYDQTAIIRKKKRVKRSSRFLVNFKQISAPSFKQIPRQIRFSRKQWPICFEGDLFHRHFKWNQPDKKFISILSRPIKVIYRLLLEKTTLS